MPNGYRSAMRIFTNTCKVPFSLFRERRFLSVIYVDESCLQKDSSKECFLIVLNTTETVRSLGFTIQPENSIFVPKQSLSYLVFVLDFIKMTISLNLEGKEKVYSVCKDMLQKEEIIIRQLLKLIGNLVAVFPAVTSYPFYYRGLEKESKNSDLT